MGHRPHSNFAEDTSAGIKSLVSDIISVRQMTTSRWSYAEETITVNLPLFEDAAAGLIDTEPSKIEQQQERGKSAS
jgi:hypothetical protein